MNGKIVAANTADIDDSSVYAHVKTEANGGVTYTSLEVALAEASSGDTIELNRTYVLYAGKELTIPAGVTVDATASDDYHTEFVVIGSDLTVNGTLIVDDFYFVATTDDSKELTVTGFLMAENPGAAATEDKWFTPIGVSYVQTITNANGDDVEYFIITGLSNIQYAIDNSDDKEVTIEGKAKLDDVSLSGGEGDAAIVNFRKDVNAGTITLDNVRLVFSDGKKINATVADSQGSIVLKGGYAVDGFEIYSIGEGVYMTGEITDHADATYSITFNGRTGMEEGVISWGHYVVTDGHLVYPTIVFAGDTLSAGKKNEIRVIGEREWYGHDIVTVSGTLTAAASNRLLVGADIEVTGSLAANEKSSAGTAGILDLEGDVYIGTTRLDIYNADEVVSSGGHLFAPLRFGNPGYDYTADVAVLSGKANIDGYLVVLAGSAVDTGVTEDFDSFDIFVDGSLWITIYKGDEASGTFYLDGLKAPVMNAKVSKIVNQDDVEVAVYDDTYNVVKASKRPISFGTDDAVYFNVKYDVFTIYIKTDASIKTVYLDGILMKTGQQENQFYLENQTAGKHTISVEPMTGYTAANAYLYDDNGVALPGLTFSFDREDCVQLADGSYGFNIWYNVAGTQLVEPEIAVAGWDITTILLLVLVILIAIMAVIVALRLNRN